jgi:molecular chaperone DnaJ
MDIYCEVPVTYAQAVLGDEIELPGLTGERIKLRIPPGTQSGEILRLRGQGIGDGSGRRGSLMARIYIEVPTRIDRRQEELLREFARLEEEKRKKGEKNFFRRVRDLFV